MYVVIYLFPVPVIAMRRFLEIQAEEAVIYKEHGALSYETFRAGDLSAKFGTSSVLNAVEIKEGEELALEIDSHTDKKTHDAVLISVDKDARNAEFYREICQLIDVNRVLRGEFES